jgi:hypothetical protein
MKADFFAVEFNCGRRPVPTFIFTTCGTQFTESGELTTACTICQDERQERP